MTKNVFVSIIAISKGSLCQWRSEKVIPGHSLGSGGAFYFGFLHFDYPSTANSWDDY